MANISRDSLKDTKNALAELRGLIAPGQTGVRHYVGVRQQQAVPVLDADWNELEDIRRLDLEVVLANTIGNGVPVGSDGFHILPANVPNSILIADGLLFLDGWLAYNRAAVTYATQPYGTAKGVAPVLPDLQNATVAERDLVYLDAWEFETGGLDDVNLVNPRIGMETCVRVERAWVVRFANIGATADPLDPASIPNRQPAHRYYPLSLINRAVGNQISDNMIQDLRRTSLTLGAVTHAPLLVFNAASGQRLDSSRLATMFRATLDTLADVLSRSPEIFIYTANVTASWQAMTLLQDVRASATAFEQQARNVLLHRQAAGDAMQSFFQVQIALFNQITAFKTAGIATAAAVVTFLGALHDNLLGAVANDPQSLDFALKANDVLGAVLAQERLNQTLGAQSNTLPEGTVTANLISVQPAGVVAAATDYQVTVRVQNRLTSTQATEPIRVTANAGPGWTLTFQGTTQPNPNETLVPVPNQTDFDVVLVVRAAVAAPVATTLTVDVRPERRQQLVYHVPPAPLAIGQQILPAAGLVATLTYTGPALQPGNIGTVPRATMATPTGLSLPFEMANLANTPQQFRLSVTAQSASTGWVAPNQPVVSLAAAGSAGDKQTVNLTFRISDQAGALSPLVWRMEMFRTTGGANDDLINTRFDLTFNLT